MRSIVSVAFVASLAGCQPFVPPHDTAPRADDDSCGTARPSELTALVPAFALLAALAFYEAKQPGQPPPANCGDGIGLFGGPSCTPSNAAADYRALAWASVVAGSAVAVAAAASWAHVARCTPEGHRDMPVAPAPTLQDAQDVSEVSGLARARCRAWMPAIATPLARSRRESAHSIPCTTRRSSCRSSIAVRRGNGCAASSLGRVEHACRRQRDCRNLSLRRCRARTAGALHGLARRDQDEPDRRVDHERHAPRDDERHAARRVLAERAEQLPVAAFGDARGPSARAPTACR